MFATPLPLKKYLFKENKKFGVEHGWGTTSGIFPEFFNLLPVPGKLLEKTVIFPLLLKLS